MWSGWSAGGGDAVPRDLLPRRVLRLHRAAWRVWNFSDVMNGLMAIPNLIGLLILSGLVARETRAYLRHDPKLEASRAEIERFMKGEPGWEEWQMSERTAVHR